MPHEEDHFLAGLAELAVDVRRPAGGVEDDRVSPFQVGDRLQLVLIADRGGRQELDREIGRGLQLVQFALDPRRLGFGVLLGLNPAPRAPAGLRVRVAAWRRSGSA